MIGTSTTAVIFRQLGQVYLTAAGGWTNDPAKAKQFESGKAAMDAVRGRNAYRNDHVIVGLGTKHEEHLLIGEEKALTVLGQAEADADDELESLKVRILEYDQGVRAAFGQQMGYAFLAGCALNRAKEVVPHGKFIPWCESFLPESSRAGANMYRRFSTALLEQHPTVGKCTTVVHLTSGDLKQIGNGELPEAEKEEVLKAVHEVADGKTLTEMYRDLGVIRQPKEKVHHPVKLTDEERVQAENDAADDVGLEGCVYARLLLEEDDPTLGRMQDKIRRELRELHISLGKRIDALSPKKKSSRKDGPAVGGKAAKAIKGWEALKTKGAKK